MSFNSATLPTLRRGNYSEEDASAPYLRSGGSIEFLKRGSVLAAVVKTFCFLFVFCLESLLIKHKLFIKEKQSIYSLDHGQLLSSVSSASRTTGNVSSLTTQPHSCCFFNGVNSLLLLKRSNYVDS